MFVFLFALLSACGAFAEVFVLPTPNKSILQGGLSEAYLVGTVGKPWPSGGFGCVRSEGFQMHEGLDIRATQRDKAGEPTDPIYAAAAGTVAYISANPALSNYGRYIVLRHQIDGLIIHTIYAHLSKIAPGLNTGESVTAGQTIATMGRSANTRQGISKDRAHLHFEVAMRLSDRYATWHAANMAGARNDHGEFNGHNFVSIDPAAILTSQNKSGFSLAKHLRDQKEAVRVLVRDTNFPLLKSCVSLIKRSAKADKEGAVAYEIAFSFSGFPIELIPRAASEVTAKTKVTVLSVDEGELARNKCCKLVSKRSGRWQLTASGTQRLSLITF
jgi:peptidoglycan LD-endopeptidase LytH